MYQKKGKMAYHSEHTSPPPAPVILPALGELDLAYFDSYLFY